MAFIDDLVSVQITASTRTPTRKSFGIPLIMSQEKPSGWGALRVRSFDDASDLITAGFSPTGSTYLLAQAISSQSPSVDTIKVGIRNNIAERIFSLTVDAAVVGDVIELVVDGETITYTIATTSAPSIAAALAALFLGTGPAAVSASADGSVIEFGASNEGVEYAVSGWYDGTGNLTLTDISEDPGIAADLTACLNADSNFYGVVLDGAGSAEILAAAAWTEANKRVFACESGDSANLDPESTTDVLYLLKVAGYTRTYATATTESTRTGVAAGILGSRLPATPGSDTWAYKPLAGVPVNAMRDDEIAAVLAKNANIYVAIAGLNLTMSGISPAGVYLDQVRGIDWLQSEMQTRVFAKLASAPGKVAFTDPGISSFAAIVEGLLIECTQPKINFLAANPAPVVTQPLAADIDPSIKATRRLPGIAFIATLAGAIQGLTITGSLAA